MLRFKEQTWFTGVPLLGTQNLAYNIDKPYSTSTYNYSTISTIFPVQYPSYLETKHLVFMLPVLNEQVFYGRTSFIYPANELHRARLFQKYKIRFSRKRFREEQECQQ